MISLARVVENQAALSSYRATQDEARAVQLELLIEATKQKNAYHEWDTLISTPFRYDPPHPQARFRPAFGKNVFYGSIAEETVLYEHAYYFMRERMHLNKKVEIGIRTLFFVNAVDNHVVDIRKEKNFALIMDKKDYSVSHQFIENNPNVAFILYPSCRDPLRRDNAAILDIRYLEKKPKWETTIKFFYDYKKNRLTWVDYKLHIDWKDIS